MGALLSSRGEAKALRALHQLPRPQPERSVRHPEGSGSGAFRGLGTEGGGLTFCGKSDEKGVNELGERLGH